MFAWSSPFFASNSFWHRAAQLIQSETIMIRPHSPNRWTRRRTFPYPPLPRTFNNSKSSGPILAFGLTVDCDSSMVSFSLQTDGKTVRKIEDDQKHGINPKQFVNWETHEVIHQGKQVLENQQGTEIFPIFFVETGPPSYQLKRALFSSYKSPTAVRWVKSYRLTQIGNNRQTGRQTEDFFDLSWDVVVFRCAPVPRFSKITPAKIIAVFAMLIEESTKTLSRGIPCYFHQTSLSGAKPRSIACTCQTTQIKGSKRNAQA